MFDDVSTWLPLLVMGLTASICFIVASVFVAQTDPRP